MLQLVGKFYDYEEIMSNWQRPIWLSDNCIRVFCLPVCILRIAFIFMF